MPVCGAYIKHTNFSYKKLPNLFIKSIINCFANIWSILQTLASIIMKITKVQVFYLHFPRKHRIMPPVLCSSEEMLLPFHCGYVPREGVQGGEKETPTELLQQHTQAAVPCHPYLLSRRRGMRLAFLSSPVAQYWEIAQATDSAGWSGFPEVAIREYAGIF